MARNFIGVILIGNYHVIGDTGRTIIKLLRENMVPDPIPKPELIELCSPAETGDFRLTLYLYSVKENGEFRNSGSVRNSGLSLSLFYLLTVHSAAELKSRAYEENYMLGKAMQVMDNHGIVKGSALHGALAENAETVKINLYPLSADEMSKLWIFPNIPYQLSVAYMVGPVTLDPAPGSGSGAPRVME